MSAMQSGLRDPLSIRRLLILLLFAVTACVRPPDGARAPGGWFYEVEAPGVGSRTVFVQATFDDARADRIAVARESFAFVRGLERRTRDGWTPVERVGGEWREPACARHCTIRYSIDLGELAAACGDEIDCARRVGEATLSPALAWLIHPSPTTDASVVVNVHTPPGAGFASGMNAVDDTERHFEFRSFDLDEGSFTAFGPMRRTHVDADDGRARIDVAVLGSHAYAMNEVAMKAWIDDAARVVTPLFGRFPVNHATLFVVPAKGEEEVVFGKVLSLAGASVVLVVGDKMSADARHRDWVLVHELFHLGFPTFRGEGRWLGEGLATYYEPVLRARAGWISDADVYRQFARNMPRGMPAQGRAGAGLAHREDLDSIYWGGALFCFAADVRIREETHGRHSLDDVIRAALARGGDATQVWSVAEIMRLGDAVTGTTVLSSMYERHAARGERIDLSGLLGSLGVDPTTGSSALVGDERRSLAWIRRDILGRTSVSVAANLRREPALASP